MPFGSAALPDELPRGKRLLSAPMRSSEQILIDASRVRKGIVRLSLHLQAKLPDFVHNPSLNTFKAGQGKNVRRREQMQMCVQDVTAVTPCGMPAIAA